MLKEITVLIPTYNRPELLNKNLESISSQDFDGKIKCVISDNASTEATDEVVNKWKNNNKNIYISYIKNLEPIPPIENFISTTKDIDTEYCKFLQDDDWLEPNALSKISHYLNIYNADSLIFNCNIFSYTQNEPRYNYYKLNNSEITKSRVIDSFLRIDNTIPTSPSISVQKSSIIREALNFGIQNIECTPLLLGNDLIFTYYGVFNDKKVFFIDESIVNFWGGKDSITMYADRHLFSSCYFKSLLMLIHKFNYEPNEQQLEVIRHRIFVHNFKKLYKKELSNIEYHFPYEQKLSKRQLLKFLKTKLS
jgi:abequosyltransferase